MAQTQQPPEPSAAEELRRSIGGLATTAISRMENDLPWYGALYAEDRSWVNLVAQRGISAFVEWYTHPGQRPTVTTDVFGPAPRSLTRAISLEQTVQLIRVTIDVVESHVAQLTVPDAHLKTAVLEYSREVAFAAAAIYAHAAEERGAWDARLEALIIDALVRGDEDDNVLSRAGALGWAGRSPVTVILGLRPDGVGAAAAIEHLHRLARDPGWDLLAGSAGERLFAVVGGAADVRAAARIIAPAFSQAPIVVGDPVPTLAEAARSARSAERAFAASGAWSQLPRPALAHDLLPERALNNDAEARQELITTIYLPLRQAGVELLQTLDALAAHGGVESASRALFVHPNTVRYRLRKIAETTGLSATEPREGYLLNIALTVGRLAEASDL
jgi:hypothetical protein